MRSVCLLLALPAASPAQPKLEFAADVGVQPVRILLDRNGSVIVGSSARGIETISFGESYPAQTIPLGSGRNTPSDAALDSAGNLWIVGNTTSDDFPLVNPIVAKKVPYRQTGFAVELDPTGAVRFATYLGGQGGCQLACTTEASAVTADQSGNVYVAGTTDEADFPTTPGALLTSGPRVDAYGNTYYYSFVLKLSAPGKLAYSTFLGTGGQQCQRGDSACLKGRSTSSRVDSLAADDHGAVTAAESMSQGPGRITRLSPDGASAVWKADTGIAAGGIPRLLLAQDRTGAVTLFGSSAPLLDPLDPRSGNGPPTLFVERLSSDGSLTARLDLGVASSDARPSGIALDAAGNLWLDGTDSSAADALSGGDGAGADFLLGIDAATRKPAGLLRFPRGVVAAGLAIDPQQNRLIPGPNSALLTVPPGYSAATPMLVGFVNAASFEPNTGAYPGAIVSLFGIGLRASDTVRIAGVEAPVLYAGPNQINVQVPFEANAGRVDLTLPSENLAIPLPITRSLGLFTTDGTHAAAVNEDGTANSASNPAAIGSIVTLYGTGAVWPKGIATGGVPSAASALNQERNGFQVVDLPAEIPQDIVYAGAAPSVIDGVFQLNVRVPSGIVVTAGGEWQLRLQSVLQPNLPPSSSNTVRVYVQ